ncbi:23592_t:CDS:2 [Cetraspora pellucida]|uniref:23592_t:CDS:1 n=1 Tax=Cetraspora pellucida TaxID=1433469 RepID=A0A9N8VK41_9GLOM|nr:23592_t:CDS:2 [Cetraspora pellucida]
MFDDSLIRSWTMIRKVTKYGFITSNELRVKGPVILINGTLFLWNVPQGSFGQEITRIDNVFNGWNKDFLKIFEIITPKPELLIFGTGKMSVPIPLEIRDYIHKLGLQIEYSDTDNAVSTFNVLAEEGRNVAAAFLPINSIHYKPREI